MALWRPIVYGTLALGILILILLLNFAYLPSRQLRGNTIESTSGKSDGKRTASSSVTPSKSTPFTPKFEDPELSLEGYKTRSWNCSRTNTSNVQITANSSISICYNELKDPYTCLADPVHCKHPRASVKRHDTHWPTYGEYTYLPRSRWSKVLLHGGVLFLYNPCAPPKVIEGLKQVAGSCIRRHAITPYEKLPLHKYFAIVTWGCLHSGKKLNQTLMKQWIRDKAMNAPGIHVTKTGKFKEGLIVPAHLVSDIHETELCPSNESKKSTNHHPNDQSENTNGVKGTQWEESLSIKASENIVIVRGADGKPKLRHKFDSVNAAWALGSLVFLCLILVSVMMYTRPWKQRDYWWRTDDITYNSNSRFNILRSNWRRANKRRSAAHERLLGPIPEEYDDEI